MEKKSVYDGVTVSDPEETVPYTSISDHTGSKLLAESDIAEDESAGTDPSGDILEMNDVLERFFWPCQSW